MWSWYPSQSLLEDQFSSVQLLSYVWLFATPWTAACQASLSITNSWSLPRLMSPESVIPFNHFILVVPFSSCLQSFPASGSFPISRFFESGGQSIGGYVPSKFLVSSVDKEGRSDTRLCLHVVLYAQTHTGTTVAWPLPGGGDRAGEATVLVICLG